MGCILLIVLLGFIVVMGSLSSHPTETVPEEDALGDAVGSARAQDPKPDVSLHSATSATSRGVHAGPARTTQVPVPATQRPQRSTSHPNEDSAASHLAMLKTWFATEAGRRDERFAGENAALLGALGQDSPRSLDRLTSHAALAEVAKHHRSEQVATSALVKLSVLNGALSSIVDVREHALWVETRKAAARVAKQLVDCELEQRASREINANRLEEERQREALLTQQRARENMLRAAKSTNPEVLEGISDDQLLVWIATKSAHSQMRVAAVRRLRQVASHRLPELVSKLVDEDAQTIISDWNEERSKKGSVGGGGTAWQVDFDSWN